MEKRKIVCRFAPSPTGPLHVGGVRSALFNYLFARQNGGKLILRIEDTDLERSKVEYEHDIVDGFRWLGLEFDETVRQSDRTEIYKKYLKNLIDSGSAYISKEEATEGKRSEVIRFKNPNRKIVFSDLIKGEISFDTTELKDFVIAKSLEEPLYHLAVVVDDFEMGITHVIRGEDHISNTPRQILIGEAIGATVPEYAHIPLLLAPDKSKLSKRKHGEQVSLKFYRDRGFLPAALLNYLVLLGWNPGTEQEMFSLGELVKEFKLDKVQKSNAIFSLEKLSWFNKQYLTAAGEEELLSDITGLLKKRDELKSLSAIQIDRLSAVLKERINYLGEVDDIMASDEFGFVVKEPVVNQSELAWKGDKDAGKLKNILTNISEIISSASDYPESVEIKNLIMPYAEKEGRGSVLWPLRFALTGQAKSPDPFTVISIIGRDRSLQRIQTALSKVE